MIRLGTLAAAAVIAIGMCSLSTEAFAARGGAAHFGGGGARMAGGGARMMGGGGARMGAATLGGGVAHFGGPRVAGSVGAWRGPYRYGFRRYGYGGLGLGLGLGLGGWAGSGPYASCYVWTPQGYINECGYGYDYYW